MSHISIFQRIFGAMLALFYISLVVLSIAATPAGAASPQQLTCEGSGGKWTGGKCADNTTNGPTVPATITNVINILLFVIGAAAVIVIVVQAFRFVNSNGDTQAVSKAKNGIIFALVGLVVAVMAYAIVNFVLDQL